MTTDPAPGDGRAALDRFSPATRAWFDRAFPQGPTPAQEGAWAAIAEGGNALVVAPTGSGKTLSAFLWALDRLAAGPPPADRTRRCRVLYVSPLKALAADIERNLRAPLSGIRREAERAGDAPPAATVGVRTGDTPADQRRTLATAPPDILITTPESLFLVLTSRARAGLAGVETVIVDEVHALAGTKRGAHLALTLERLDALLDRPAQRIGLSATVRPAEEVAAFLGGARPAAVVAPPSAPRLDLRIAVPVADMTELEASVAAARTDDRAAKARTSIWPHVEERVLDLVERHHSSIVFTNSRRVAERLCARLNELAAERGLPGAAPGPDAVPAEVPAQSGQARTADGTPVVARAHHGSVSKSERAAIEADLKAGRLPCVVATSSLELGIDMGAVDLVVQVESPPSVASGLQRVGRAGHGVGEVSRGVLFPKYRGDLLAATVVAERMRAGAIEELHMPRNPLDVLAQQVVAMAAMDDWAVADLAALVRRAAPFAALPDSALAGVLDMLSGRYPSDEFAELRPRVVWDRDAAGGGTVRGRPGAQRLAVTSGGTIPDRGTYAVHLAGTGGAPDGGGRGGRAPTRVGELDEEMVYESRVGDVFVLGASAWRIEGITADRVLVSPAPGRPGRLPFWKADAVGRPLELGRAIGALTRELADLDGADAARRAADAGLDAWAADNLVGYLAEQREATGHVPDDRTIVVERFRDELGDWRAVVHSPLGARVHAPWALLIGARLRARYGVDAQVVHGDDGIVVRLPDVEDGGRAARAGALADVLSMAPEEVEDAVAAEIGGSALFAARFRECAARALLLPRRRPGRRMPLWQQRQRSAQLLSVAARYGSFPIVLEAVRECLRDVFDVAGLAELMGDLAARRVRVVEVETPHASPFAQSLLIGYTAAFLYEGDAPLAELKAQALTLDASLLSDLLGQADLRELLDAAVVAEEDARLQRLAPGTGVAARARVPGVPDGRGGARPDGGPEAPEGEGAAGGADTAPRDTAPPDTADPRARERAVEGTADLLRELGPLSTGEAAARGVAPAWLADLEAARRAVRVRVAGAPRWAAVEDAARLRDALGTVLPDWLSSPEAGAPRPPAPGPGTGADGAAGAAGAEDTGARTRPPGERADGEWADAHPFAGTAAAFTAPVADPVGDLVSRYARTHGPFTVGDAAARFGLGPAVVHDALRRLAGAGRVVEGGFRPGGTGTEWCDADVLRRLRRRSVARLRREVEPVAQRALARFVPAWQGVTPPAAAPAPGARGLPPRPADPDAVFAAVEALRGAPVPASALESLVLPARVPGYSPALLDALTLAGEVVWAGAGPLSGGDGWVCLVPADEAALLLPDPGPPPEGAVAAAVLTALEEGGALFFRDLADRVTRAEGVAAVSDAGLVAALWDLIWAGRVGNDSLTPLRALLGAGGTAHRSRSRRAAMPTRTGPPTAAGRWSPAPALDTDPTRRGHAGAAALLDRHGVVTRGAVVAEQDRRPGGAGGGFSAVYPVLRAFEEAGRARRGYFVEGLGAAQFALPGAVDRLRGMAAPDRDGGTGGPSAGPGDGADAAPLVLAAADPANAYGAALPWPEPPEGGGRPGRKAGALVVLDDGALVLYLERGGRSALTFGAEGAALDRAAAAVADAVRAGRVAGLTVERCDGLPVFDTPLDAALTRAGFHPVPKGLRLRT
ncbi:DEAD/DEAH box helicase [Nocardiopsis trehalosi]|uniref:DEAD/DEAH box helicase n=1 Tax=Nocardiopsis trehalosi TaxID=109329 RepID=UPI00082DE6DF|nr:DEAD/DEAH box helicase [Nocardiopsis trehalosi]